MKKGVKFKAVVDDNGGVKNQVKVSDITEADLVSIMVPMFFEMTKASGRKGKALDIYRMGILMEITDKL